MNWLTIGFSLYSFYMLFLAETSRDLGLSLVRFAVAMIFLAFICTQNENVVAIAVLANVSVVLVGMVIMRKEVQIKNDEL